jgi:hypothetical protein
MQDTPWSDGVPGLSQTPIEPGESYVYRFTAYPPGQYWSVLSAFPNANLRLIDPGTILIREPPCWMVSTGRSLFGSPHVLIALQ